MRRIPIKNPPKGRMLAPNRRPIPEPINSISAAKIKALHQAILDVLNEAVKDAYKSYKRPGSYQEKEFAVYGRKGEPCIRCKGKVARIVQGGRSTYFCPGCQRE